MSKSDAIRIGYTPGQDVTLDHLQDQIEWYDLKSGSNQKAFKYLKVCTVAAAAIIPVLAKLDGMSSVTAGLGVLIVILEGLQQLNQYHSNWIAYRSTCETLKHEKFSLSRKSWRIRHGQRSTRTLGGTDRIPGFPRTRKVGFEPGTRAEDKRCPWRQSLKGT
jgi:hypothetical protein